MITEIAQRAGKSASQVILRWHIQRGDIVFPKSVKPERIKENIEIFDFELAGRGHGGHRRPEPGRAHRPGPGHLRRLAALSTDAGEADTTGKAFPKRRSRRRAAGHAAD